MRLLVYTTLYPNNQQETHGVFVENRLRHLIARHPVVAKVCAPVPWFPFKHGLFGRYGQYARVSYREERHGVEVSHPRYLAIPKVGMAAAPPLLTVSSIRSVKSYLEREDFDFDIIDAHFCYPDGVAAVWLGRRLKKPVVLTARGNDISLYPQWRIPRAYLTWALQNADAVITVCQALADAIVALGIRPRRLEVMRNGVDLELFTDTWDREQLRRDYGFTGPTLLSVGHLIERKGHHLVIDALSELPEHRLVVVGDGPLSSSLRRQADRLGLSNRVSFLGRVPHAALPKIMCAADALVLASSREGWANVLLESMACGTPVVATAVWGTPEIVQVPTAGRLTRDRSGNGIAQAVRDLFEDYPSRRLVRKFAESFSWDDTSDAQWRLFNDLKAGRQR